MLNRVKPHLWS